MDADINDASVTISAATVAALGEDTNADLVISTPVADITLPNGALSDIAANSDEVKVSAVASGNTVSIEVADDNGVIANVTGGIKVAIPTNDATSGTVTVIVYEDGTREVVRKSVVTDDTLTVPLDGSATIEIVDNSKEFADVSAGSWYSDAVAFASSHELFNGTSATKYSPNADLTRGMLAAVLCNLERGDGTNLTNDFHDVADDVWYEDAISWAVSNGSINGYGNGFFGPNDLITREQMTAMLYNYAEMLGVDTSVRTNLDRYTDGDSVSGWAKDVMSWANAEG